MCVMYHCEWKGEKAGLLSSRQAGRQAGRLGRKGDEKVVEATAGTDFLDVDSVLQLCLEGCH